jgi:peptidoglycan/xylan/chitin deacetylase (PgdA/CDA1 family)
MNLHKLLEPVSELWIRFRVSGDWRGVRFLCYHSVAEDRHAMHPVVKDLSVTTKEFKDHLAFFHHSGLPVISMNSAIELLESGEAKESKYVCLTFDDGDMDNYTVTWQILKEFGLSAHFSVVADFMGKSFVSENDGREWVRNFMGKDEIKAILKEGGTIGCHGKTHSMLTGLETTKLASEVKKSKDQVEALLGVPIFTFAYPGALYDKVVINAIRHVGYKYAFNINYGSVRILNEKNRYTISRNLIRGNYDHGNYLTFRGGYDWAKYYSTIKTKIKSKLSR